MANMELITSVTVGAGGAATVRLPGTGSIPATYTDLKIVFSARSANSSPTGDIMYMTFNGDAYNASGYSSRHLIGSGSSASSGTGNSRIGVYPAGAATASTFGNGEIYIPNYLSSNAKSISSDTVTENNGTVAYADLEAGLWNPATQAAITSITLNPNNDTWVEGSTFYLYGISSVTSTPKATGGIVSQDASYWYHMFPFSSTFTPTVALSADILCIAGGGGSGFDLGGGGGAGGLLTFTSQSLTTTGYTVTVGAGGSAGLSAGNGGNGGNSQFGSLTASVGGGGGCGDASSAGSSGGSGGGAASALNKTGGSPTSGQGYAGGNSLTSGSYVQAANGGGGAGAIGGSQSNPSTPTGGNGGIGATSSLINAMGLATFTGQVVGSSVYFAGGGAGGTNASGIPGVGGLGGGGNGAKGSSSPTNIGNDALINTGGGGGGGGINNGNGAKGGSGLVIVRYAK